MPVYQYACTQCSEQLEVRQSFTDEALTVCPACEGRLRKVLSAVGVVFKGSGFYRTDSRSAPNGGSDSAPSGDGAKEPANGSGKDAGKDSGKDGRNGSGKDGTKQPSKESSNGSGKGDGSSSSSASSSDRSTGGNSSRPAKDRPSSGGSGAVAS